MESLLGGFQRDLGSISAEIKSLQEQSLDMGIKLRNRKAAESRLSWFIEEMVVPPELVDTIMDGEVNEAFVRALQSLHRKLQFAAEEPAARTAAALKDVEPVLHKLRARALFKGREYLMQKVYALRKPKTNVQILQQSVLLKYKYVATFLQEHEKDVFADVRAAYVETMNKVLSSHFRTYIHALEKLQLDNVSRTDLIGVEDSSKGAGGLFARGQQPLKNRSAVFSLGDRASVLQDTDEPAIIPHIAELGDKRFAYEVLFRSLSKLLMDTATSEYLFCSDFFGEDVTFQDIFAGPFAVINEHLTAVLPNCFDAIGLMLMIRMTHQHQVTSYRMHLVLAWRPLPGQVTAALDCCRMHLSRQWPMCVSQLLMVHRRVPCLDPHFDKVNLMIWPRFKVVMDMQLQSVRAANVRSLWAADVHPHYVTRRYAEFAASLMQLSSPDGSGDGQLNLNLERLRAAVDDLLVKLARMFPAQKQQTIFLINNYDLVLAILKEAGVTGGRTLHLFEDLLTSSSTVFVVGSSCLLHNRRHLLSTALHFLEEEELREHFGSLIAFVKVRAGSGDEQLHTGAGPAPPPIMLKEVEPLVKDFAARWKAAIEVMHKDIITNFSNFVCGMEILRAALTQLLLYYTRLSDCLKRVEGASVLGKDVVSTSSIMYEIKKYSRT
eukprot:SM000002S05499  [mRNA]  locus=s2:102884:106791:+ [translate_table: standard]